jgi:hypothetical protein
LLKAFRCRIFYLFLIMFTVSVVFVYLCIAKNSYQVLKKKKTLSLFHFSSLHHKVNNGKQTAILFTFFLDIFFKTCNILFRFCSRNTNLDILGNCMSLAHRKSTNSLVKMDFKLRNKLKSKCVQFFDTPCTLLLTLGFYSTLKNYVCRTNRQCDIFTS